MGEEKNELTPERKWEQATLSSSRCVQTPSGNANALAMNLTAEQASKISGLPLDEVKKLSS